MKKSINSLLVAIIALAGSVAHAGNSSCNKADIVDTAVAAGQFNTLAAALTAADLVTTLKSVGPFTVFAPVDAAFDKLPAGTVNALLGDIPALKNILLYHVAAGKISPSKLASLGKIATVQGTEVNVQKTGNQLYVNNSAVLDVVQASNGIIYIIDTVLLP